VRKPRFIARQSKQRHLNGSAVFTRDFVVCARAYVACLSGINTKRYGASGASTIAGFKGEAKQQKVSNDLRTGCVKGGC
jgi:hypothetical protein